MRYILLCILLFLSACASIPQTFLEPPDTPEPVPERYAAPEYTAPSHPLPVKAENTLRLSMRTPFTLNPLLNMDATVDNILKLIFEPLVILDENLKPADHLASYNFSSDYTSVNLTLRYDAIWSDGTPVTADDIIFSVSFLQNAPEGAIYKPYAANIAACEKLDTKTVKITFAAVSSGSAYMLAFPIIPQHYYRGETNPASKKNMEPLGNGLFMFSHIQPLVSLTLRQSPYPFRPQASIEKVEALFIADAETGLHAFTQGLTDAIAMEMTEWSKQTSVKKIRYEEYPAMYFDFIGFNFRHEWLAHKQFRQAVAHAFDADGHISRIYLTHAQRAATPVHPASWLYDETVPVYAYDMDLARSSLRLARQDLRTLLIGDQVPLRVLVNRENDQRVKIAESLVRALEELEIKMELEILPFEDFAEKLETGDYDIFVGSYHLSKVPDLTFAFHSGGNLLRYGDPDLDALLDAAKTAYSENEHIRVLSALQHHIAEELPVISLAFRNSAVLTDVRINGALNPSLWYSLAGVNGWRLE
jgi:peptide/nickel transport system substrate-binding protein